MSAPLVGTTDLGGAVTLVRLARGGKRNAMTPEMFQQLQGGISAAADAGQAIVLAGEGPAFCGGFDLEMCHAHAGTMERLLRALGATIALLRALPVPVVVAAHGAAIAGGCALLCGADVVVTNVDARLGYPVTRLGVSPAVNAPHLRSLMDGAARARLVDPGLVSGADALRTGLVHEAVRTPEEVLPRAVEIARALRAKPAGAYASTRAWLAEIDPSPARYAGAGLAASLALADGPEQRALLAAAMRELGR